jgi:hypothetical protein
MLRMPISSVDIVKIRRKPFAFARTRVGTHMVHIALRTIEEDA